MQPSNFAKALSFSVFQNTTHHETNFLSKQLYFQSNIDYIEIQLLCPEPYFFLITSSWQQTNFLISYFLKTNTFSAQLLFRRRFFSRISDCSEHILSRSRYFLPNSYFLRKRAFLGGGVSWKQSLFLIVLRNQFHSIY